MRDELKYEILAIGLITAILYYAYLKLTDKLKEVKLSDHFIIVLIAFISGGTIHFIFEVLGLNERWCRATYAGLEST